MLFLPGNPFFSPTEEGPPGGNPFGAETPPSKPHAAQGNPFGVESPPQSTSGNPFGADDAGLQKGAGTFWS